MINKNIINSTVFNYCNNIIFFYIYLIFYLFLILSFSANAYLLSDSFESSNMSTTNSDGFSWSAMNRTTIVTMNPAPRIVYPITGDGPIGANWTAKDGSNSLRFHYRGCNNPGGSEDDYHWSAQRFSLGTAQRDLWVRFWFKVPENYIHTTSSCSQGINNKFFTMWQDTYSSGGAGATAFIGWWSSSTNPGGSILTTGGWQSDAGGGSHTGDTPGIDDSNRFITYPTDRGRWMQIVINLKAETNGWIKVWRRWENESSFRLMSQTLNYYAAPPPSGHNGWMYGYFIGYTNSAFPTDTDFLVDAVTISDQSLLASNNTICPPTNLRILY